MLRANVVVEREVVEAAANEFVQLLGNPQELLRTLQVKLVAWEVPKTLVQVPQSGFWNHSFERGLASHNANLTTDAANSGSMLFAF